MEHSRKTLTQAWTKQNKTRKNDLTTEKKSKPKHRVVYIYILYNSSVHYLQHSKRKRTILKN